MVAVVVILAVVVVPGVVLKEQVVVDHTTAHLVVQLMKQVELAEQHFQVPAK
jgi:hypothetical protein